MTNESISYQKNSVNNYQLKDRQAVTQSMYWKNKHSESR